MKIKSKFTKNEERDAEVQISVTQFEMIFEFENSKITIPLSDVLKLFKISPILPTVYVPITKDPCPNCLSEKKETTDEMTFCSDCGIQFR